MKTFDFNNKTFMLVKNTDAGKAGTDTLFKYAQEGDLVTADYQGGDVRYGKIIAQQRSDRLHMVYQCLTFSDELKAGKAVAEIELDANNKINLKLDWQWLDGSSEKGSSEYREI